MDRVGHLGAKFQGSGQTVPIGPVPDAGGAGGARFALGLACVSIVLRDVTTALYGAQGLQIPEAAEFLGPLVTSIPIIAWFRNYSVERRIAWPMDMGYFLIAGWLVLIPYYVIRQERRAGLSKVALFGLFCLASFAIRVAIEIWMRL